MVEQRINDCESNDKPCKFWIDGKCIAKDEDLITEEEFENLLENPRVYDRALTEGEIKKIYEKETNQGED